MDTRLCTLLVIVCSHDGSLVLRQAPSIRATAAVHRRLLWLYCSHTLLFHRPSQHHPDSHLCRHPACLSAVVPRELLPNGLEWSAPCHHLWRSPGSCLDDWLGWTPDRTLLLLMAYWSAVCPRHPAPGRYTVRQRLHTVCGPSQPPLLFSVVLPCIIIIYRTRGLPLLLCSPSIYLIVSIRQSLAAFVRFLCDSRLHPHLHPARCASAMPTPTDRSHSHCHTRSFGNHGHFARAANAHPRTLCSCTGTSYRLPCISAHSMPHCVFGRSILALLRYYYPSVVLFPITSLIIR